MIVAAAASGTIGALGGLNRHHRFEVHTGSTSALFEAALVDPAFANN